MSSSSDQVLPERFGPFSLIRQLGKGGIGRVYLAIAKTVGGERKLLAVKRLLTAYNDDPELVSMLADEASLSVWLHHPNIAQVFDFGQVQGAHYIAMEFVDGCDLHSLVRGPRGSHVKGHALPVPTALFVLLRVAEALDQAHRARDGNGRPLNTVHRDVSPHNVLLSRDGEVKLTDFGLARTEISTHQTKAGIVRGKFAYMPKEQAHGHAIDHRIDLFAAGVTLYETLTGVRPYSSTNLAQQLYQLERTIEPPSAISSEIPPEVDTIVQRAIQPDPAQRYQQARELARDLRRALLAISEPIRETERLAQLVRRAVPRRPATVESLPRLSIAEVKPTNDSLIADAVVAAQRTIVLLSQSVLESATSAPGTGESSSPGSAPHSAELSLPVTVIESAPGSVQPDTSGRAPAPTRRPTPSDGSSRGQGDARPHANVASPEEVQDGKVVGGTIDSSQVLAERAPSKSRRGADGAQAAPTAAPGLVKALQKAADGGRQGTDAALAAFENALADRQRRVDPEYDQETAFVRQPAAGTGRAVFILLAIALIGAGIVGGWLWRDRQQASEEASRQLAGTDGPSADEETVYPLPWPPAAPGAQAPYGDTADSDRLRSARHRDKASRETRGTRRRAKKSAQRTKTRRVRPKKRRSRKPLRIPEGGGSLMVTSARPAAVLINDRRAGRTPARLGLEAGIYRVKVVYEDDAASPVKFVTIDQGSKATLAF